MANQSPGQQQPSHLQCVGVHREISIVGLLRAANRKKKLQLHVVNMFD